MNKRVLRNYRQWKSIEVVITALTRNHVKSIKKVNNYLEEYRSGHNGPDSKSGRRQRLVGSNPTSSAKNPLKMLNFQGIFL